MALSVAAALIDPTYKEMVEALASHLCPRHVENSTTQLSARKQKWMESLTEFGHAVRKQAKCVYPEAENQMQDR